MNNRGQVVGESLTSSRDDHAFLWQKGSMTDLGTLGGRRSAAVAINDQGLVVGTSTTSAGALLAFLWQRGTMTDLGSLPGEDSRPTALNAHGDIVGYTQRSQSDPDHTVLWKNGLLHDLGSFGSKVKQAITINSVGQILVSTSRPDMHAYLWQNGHSTKIWPRYTAARSKQQGLDRRHRALPPKGLADPVRLAGRHDDSPAHPRRARPTNERGLRDQRPRLDRRAQLRSRRRPSRPLDPWVTLREHLTPLLRVERSEPRSPSS